MSHELGAQRARRITWIEMNDRDEMNGCVRGSTQEEDWLRSTKSPRDQMKKSCQRVKEDKTWDDTFTRLGRILVDVRHGLNSRRPSCGVLLLWLRDRD